MSALAQDLYDRDAAKLVEALCRPDPQRYGGGAPGLYFLHAPGARLIKIGWSEDPWGRAEAVVKPVKHREVVVTRIVPGHTEHDENLLWHHFVPSQRFWDAHLLGLPHPTEWFDDDDPELRRIAGIG